MITSFHEGMQGTVQYDGSSSDPFPVRNGVKEGCVLAPTLFDIFFSLLLSYTFSQSEDAVYLCTWSDRSLFSLTHLWAKTKVWRVLIRKLLFVDAASLTAHTEEALQWLISCFTYACREFGPTISLRKTKIMGQDISSIPSISIGDYTLEVVKDFTCLGSTIFNNLPLDAELNTWIIKAATAMACLAKRVWENSMLTTNIKMKVYQAYVLSTLLYGSAEWTLYSHQECRLNAFCLHYLRRILGITSQDHVLNKNVLAQAGILSMIALLTQRHLHWLAHISCMQNWWIPKDMLYDKLVTSSRPVWMIVPCFKDICKWDLKAGNINASGWEAVAADCSSWRPVIKAGIQMSEQKREDQWEVRGQFRQQRTASATMEPGTDYICSNCNRACHSRIGLYSHSRHCNSTTD